MKSWKYCFINGKNVNPKWVIKPYYMVSKDGVIFNAKTGNFIYPNEITGKVTLNADCNCYTLESHNGRANFNIKNIIAATFYNEYTYGKHIK